MVENKQATKKGTPNILREIVAQTVADIENSKARRPEELLWRHARGMIPPPSLANALRRTQAAAPPKIIAELKKASPSKGLIRDPLRVVKLARELETAGAGALSILTEPHYFHGRLRNLRIAATNVHIPLLRKDFIVDPYQILEARVNQASAILLIVAALDREQLKDLYFVAREVQLDVLVEIHSAAELEKAMTVKPDIIGINCRDLTTFKTDLATTQNLLEHIPEDVVTVAESGILQTDDFRRISDLGADSCLIGEYLMRAKNPGGALQELLQTRS